MRTEKNRSRYNRDHLRYPSDVTDEEWGLIAPLIPAPRAGFQAKRSRPARGYYAVACSAISHFSLTYQSPAKQALLQHFISRKNSSQVTQRGLRKVVVRS
jgi:hypothetical protein